MDGLFDQELIAKADIMVVGCGALGNEVLKNLALMGVRNITVVDFDKVEPANLNRSVLFTTSDALQRIPKVEAIKRSLEKINPKINLTTIFGDIAYDVGAGFIYDADLIIGCVDNRWARYCINRWCMRLNKPWVDGGISILEGTVRVFIPGINCYACNLGKKEIDDMRRRMPCSSIIRRQESVGHAPTTPIAASIIGAIQVQEALKLLHLKYTDQKDFTSMCGKMFCYEGQHLTTRTVHFQAWDEDCPVHEQWSPICESDISIHSTVAETLQLLALLTGTNNVSFSLSDECFVDFIVRKSSSERISVMKPGRRVAQWMESIPALSGQLYSDFYQHEYRDIDRLFPYQELTLEQLGIPNYGILPVNTAEKELFVNLKKEQG